MVLKKQTILYTLIILALSVYNMAGAEKASTKCAELDKISNRICLRLNSLGYNTDNITKDNLQLPQIRSKYDMLIRKVANKTELPGFLEDISNLGKKNGLEFENFQPLGIKSGYFYNLKPIKIIASAQQSQFEQFIASLSTLPRLISLYKKPDFSCQQPNLIKAELVLIFPYFEDEDKSSVNEDGYHFSRLNDIPDLPNPKFICILNSNPNRIREKLENYSLSSLKFIGTMRVDDTDDLSALIMTPDNIVHRVKKNNYLGTNHGKIINISEQRVDLIEVFTDKSGNQQRRELFLLLVQ